MTECKYLDLCKELYEDDDERRKTCDPETCDRASDFYDGECSAMESD